MYLQITVKLLRYCLCVTLQELQIQTIMNNVYPTYQSLNITIYATIVVQLQAIWEKKSI